MATALNLKLCQDGKEENFMEWLKKQKGGIYPGVGKRTWRVPPVRFNMQKIREEKSKKKPICKLLDLPDVTDRETNRAENCVCGAFESLSKSMEDSKSSSAMFIISNFEYDNYLNKLSLSQWEAETSDLHPGDTHSQGQDEALEPVTTEEGDISDKNQASNKPVVRLPKDVANRGELDILILHQQAGLVLVQTKAVGYNFDWCQAQDEDFTKYIYTAIDRAGSQLVRDRKVMLHVMADLGLEDQQITSLIALPNLSRKVLRKSLQDCDDLKHLVKECNLEPDIHILCAEDFLQDEHGSQKALENWWRHSLVGQTQGLSLDVMEQIAYRTVGLLSTVSVWSVTQPRMEVRNLNDATWETGNRYAQVVLSPQQMELMTREEKYFYLWGPAGSGKTLLLSLKGRHWLRHGQDVAILNTRLGSKGRRVGVVMENSINRTKGLEHRTKRIDLDLMSDPAALLDDITKHVPKGQRVNFLMDEVTWMEESEKLMTILRNNFPDSAIWCAGMLEECQPKGFQSGGLLDVLRCPPSVQRVLRVVDSREERCRLYNLDSAKAGLPTDGLPAHFIIHSEHGDPAIQPYDCAECANMLADFLINKLNMKIGGSQNDQAANQEKPRSADHSENQSDLSKHPIGQSEKCCGAFGVTNQSHTVCENNPPGVLEVGCDKSGRARIDSSQSECIIRDSSLKGDNKGSDSGCCSGGEADNHDGDQNSDLSVAGCQLSHNTTASSTCAVSLPGGTEADRVKSPDKSKQHQPCAKRQNPKRGKNSVKSPTNCEVKTSATPTTLCGCPISPTAATASPAGDTNTDCSNESGNCKSNSKQSSSRKRCNKNKRKNLSGGDKCSASRENDGAKGGVQGVEAGVGAGQRLCFGDAVLPATVPKEWHNYNKRGCWAISREALSQDMLMLGSAAFCQQLQDCGVPVRVEEQMVLGGKEMENYFILCPLGAVHGLEYKVVVCVPSACHLPEYMDISQRVLYGNMGPKIRHKRTEFATNYLKEEEERRRTGTYNHDWVAQYPCKIDKIRISTHVADEGAPSDVLYERVTSDDLDPARNEGRHDSALSDIARSKVQDNKTIDHDIDRPLSLRLVDAISDIGQSSSQEHGNFCFCSSGSSCKRTGSDCHRVNNENDVNNSTGDRCGEKSSSVNNSDTMNDICSVNNSDNVYKDDATSDGNHANNNSVNNNNDINSNSKIICSCVDNMENCSCSKLETLCSKISSSVSSSSCIPPTSTATSATASALSMETATSSSLLSSSVKLDISLFSSSTSSLSSLSSSSRGSSSVSSPSPLLSPQSVSSPFSPILLETTPSAAAASNSLHQLAQTSSPPQPTTSATTMTTTATAASVSSSSSTAKQSPNLSMELPLETMKAQVCGECGTDNCVCQYFKPAELRALHRLDPWDKAYLLMCASRCTSQLILVLP